jgi:signal transduction histidine kinase
MKAAVSLSRRIAWSFILLAVLLGSFFSLVSYVAVEVIESNVIDERLDNLMDQLIERQKLGKTIELPHDVEFFVNEQIPGEFRHATSGIHEAVIGGHELQALVRTDGQDQYALVQDMDHFEEIEHTIFLALAIGFVSSVGLAVMLGSATANHVIAPVKALADAVDRGAGPAELPGLLAQDEIGALARAFAKHTDELQQFLMRERLFTGDVSHELRTPLTVMLGAAELLKAQLNGQTAQQEVAERIRRVAAETSERVSALLLLSRSPEVLDTKPIALRPLIQTEFDRCKPILIGKPVQFHLEVLGDVWVQSRPELAGIVVGNLLRNACQHTDEGMVRVKLSANMLIIEDDGTGIPHSVKTRLFERFVRGSKDSLEGTGLGLSIVKRIVDHMGWGIHYESPDEGGSRFIITFGTSSFQTA